MSLQLGRAIGDGARRIVTPTGGALFVAFLALQLLTQASINTAVLRFAPEDPTGELAAAFGMTLPVSGAVAAGLFLGAIVLTSVYFVVLSRALTRPSGELSRLPSALYTRRMGRATLSLLVGGVVVTVAVMIGFVLLVLPGVFLAACFVFFSFAVGVEDRGVLGGLRRSWGLSRGNRLKLVVLVIAAGVFGGVIGVVGTAFDLAASPLVGEVLVTALNSVFFVLLYGVLAAAYLQTRGDDPKDGDGVSESLETIGG